MIATVNSEGATCTDRVDAAMAATHIAVRNKLGGESEILEAYYACEECEKRDPVARK